jgi:iron complex outermembrane receptor protein
MQQRHTALATCAALWLAAQPVSGEPDAHAEDASGPPEGATGSSHAPTSQATDYDEILVTAAPHPRSRFDVIQGSSVISHEELDRALQPSIGETLAELPGVSSSYFGPGASRPVIRGLDGPRIRVLQNGLGTLDASVTSPDHAVASDALLARRVEIVRGAGTLLYSSAAVGGVVNVDDGRIPKRLPDEWLEGDLRALYGSAANEKSIGGGLTAGLGPVALRAAGFFRDTDDLEIPGFPVSETYADANSGTQRGPEGRVPNSDAESAGGSAGAAWIFDSGVLGAAYGVIDSDYGIPLSPAGEPTRIDLEQQRADLHGEWERDLAAFEKATLQLGYASYEHVELEAGVAGTRFENDAWEGRLELVQKEWGELHGSAGFQFLWRDFAAGGEEAFVPPNETFSWGLFAVEEIHLGSLIAEAGLRFERQASRSRARDVERSFNGVSVSAGIGWSPREDTRLGLSVSRTQRPPAAEELFSDGPHLATGGYDVGDPGLDPEIGLTVEAVIRKREGRLTGGINAFYTRFEDYIFLENVCSLDENPNCDAPAGLVRREYRQSAADFYGGEVQLALEAIRGDPFTGVIDLALDYVRAQEDDTQQPLPRIPPLRLKAGLEARSRYLDGRLELWWVGEQDRTANLELPTDAYFLLNASLTLHPLPDDYDATLLVQGRNLTDEEARNHVSYLKDFVPLPGRDVRLVLRVAF